MKRRATEFAVGFGAGLVLIMSFLAVFVNYVA